MKRATLRTWAVRLTYAGIAAHLITRALAWIGGRQRSSFAWGALIAGIVLWAQQDIAISLRANCWPHVWLDCAVLVGMPPPLLYLFSIDRAKARP